MQSMLLFGFLIYFIIRLVMNKMLRSVVSGGTGGSASFSGMTIAGKTGTTNDNFDRYFVGYTPYYSAAVWVGYAQSNDCLLYTSRCV